jgi:hypothetical protein
VDCNKILFFELETASIVPICNMHGMISSAKLPSAIVVKERAIQICCGEILSATRVSIGRNSTDLGSSLERFVAMCSSSKPLPKGEKLFAKAGRGVFWTEFNGLIESVEHWGDLLRLIINPAIKAPEAR